MALKKADVKKYQFFCEGKQLEIIHNFKYLGIVIYYNGSFKNAIEELCKQATKATFALISKCGKFDLTADIIILFYSILLLLLFLTALIYSFYLLPIVKHFGSPKGLL